MRIKDCPSCCGSGFDMRAERDALKAECNALWSTYITLGDKLATVKKVAYGNLDLLSERDALRAELAALKAQEPVAWSLQLPDGRVTLEKSYPSWIDDESIGRVDGYVVTPLYTLPTVNK